MTDRALPRRGLLVLLGVALAAGIGAGSLQVVVPSSTIGRPVLAGAAFAALAIGEVLGALAAAGRIGPASARVALRVGLAAMGGVYLVAAVGVPGVALVVVAGALGIATAVQSIGSAVLLDRVVRPHLLTAAFAAQVAAMLLGTAVGAGVAGEIGTGAALLVPASALLVVLALSALLPVDRPVRRPRVRSRSESLV